MKKISHGKLIHAAARALSANLLSIKVQTKAMPPMRVTRQDCPGPRVERVSRHRWIVAIDREAREQKLSLNDRHASARTCARILAELHALLLRCGFGTILAEVHCGNAISYTLSVGETDAFIEHPLIELSRTGGEPMRP